MADADPGAVLRRLVAEAVGVDSVASSPRSSVSTTTTSTASVNEGTAAAERGLGIDRHGDSASWT